jgi:hypothetical protein
LAWLACFGAFWSPSARNAIVVVKGRVPGAVFYHVERGRVRLGERSTAELSLAMAGRELFALVEIPFQPRDGAALYLKRSSWRTHFDGDPRLFGRTVLVSGQQAVVAGVIPDDRWRFPGRVDGWLIDDARVPAQRDGFSLARRASLPPGAVWKPPESRIPMIFFPGCLLILVIACLVLPSITSLSLGEYPGGAGLRRWVFLAVKTGLTLASAYGGSVCLAQRTEWGGSVQVLMLGIILALRWVLVDQRRRCPVCLRRLAHPVHIGDSGHTFLGWNVTELVCSRGHGLLHVPEVPAGWSAIQRWMRLDPSWNGLFR